MTMHTHRRRPRGLALPGLLAALALLLLLALLTPGPGPLLRTHAQQQQEVQQQTQEQTQAQEQVQAVGQGQVEQPPAAESQEEQAPAQSEQRQEEQAQEPASAVPASVAEADAGLEEAAPVPAAPAPAPAPAATEADVSVTQSTPDADAAAAPEPEPELEPQAQAETASQPDAAEPTITQTTEADTPSSAPVPAPAAATDAAGDDARDTAAARRAHRGAGQGGAGDSPPGHVHRSRLRTPQKAGHEGHGHVSDPGQTLIQHGGHTHTVEDAEQHGGLIFGVTIGVCLMAQAALVVWKRFRPASFDKATLVGLWLFPAAYCVWHGVFTYWRMLTLWLLFTLACGFIVRRALMKPVARSTPRLVYSFFFWVYRVSYATAVAGYLIIMCHFMGLGSLPLVPSPSSAVLLLFYGLYFGVLGRDLANVSSTSLAVSLGYVAAKGEIPRKSVPANVCAICDLELVKSFRPVNGQVAPTDEPVHTLNCGHQHHETCLRGWALIGKKDTCPSCSERVVLKETLKGPWTTPSVAWAVLLDALRYLIVFNPIVVVAAQLALYIVY